MRKPTPLDDLYAWWRAALVDPRHPRHEGDPQCGWYRTRLTKGGPWVPVEIKVKREINIATGELEDDEQIIAIIDNLERPADPLWTYVQPISREAYQQLCWTTTTIPEMAATHVPVDLTERAMRP